MLTFTLFLLPLIRALEGSTPLPLAFTGSVDTRSMYTKTYHADTDHDLLLFDHIITHSGGIYYNGEVHVPDLDGGIFWVTIRPWPRWPDRPVTLSLRVNGHPALTATGKLRADGVAAALLLQGGDLLEVTKPRDEDVGQETLFSVVKTEARSAYTGVFNINGVVYHNYPLPFTALTVKEVLNFEDREFTVLHCGIYMLSLRAEGTEDRRNFYGHHSNVPTLELVLQVNGEDVLKAFAGKTLESSAAVAWHLSQGDVIAVVVISDEKYVSSNTLVSFAEIQRTPSAAFSGRLEAPTAVTPEEAVQFSPELDLGGMWDNQSYVITVNVTGIYIVCVRPHPEDWEPLEFKIDSGNMTLAVLRAVSQMSIASGLCAALDLSPADEVKVVGNGTGEMGTESIFSIAFVQDFS